MTSNNDMYLFDVTIPINKQISKQEVNRNRDIFLKVQKSINERFGSEQGEYVDLGLPSGTLWATCNLGAKEPHEAGLYFAWGETTGYAEEQVGKDKDNRWFKESTYEHLGDNSICDSDGILEPEFDAATMNLGSEWRIPTEDEIDELCGLENKWIIDYNRTGVNGRLFIGYNGMTLFLPAVGVAVSDSVSDIGDAGNYWSSSLYVSDTRGAYGLNFDEKCQSIDRTNRCIGYSIRPVYG